MTIHVLVEGASERAFLDRWGLRLLLQERIRVHPHQGKGSLPKNIAARPKPTNRGLLDQLPATLRGFAAALDPDTDAVLILVDADDDDVEDLAGRIRQSIEQCAPNLRIRVNIAIEEMEAFYLGDLRALERVYPTANMRAARNYVPDSICGTWELFGSIIGDDGGNKVAWAEAMGPKVTVQPSQSRSQSFRELVQSIRALVPVPAVAGGVRKKSSGGRNRGVVRDRRGRVAGRSRN